MSFGWQRFDSPMQMIRKIQRCRLIVTGSYHPAVFALAKGIPAIALVKSVTYINNCSFANFTTRSKNRHSETKKRRFLRVFVQNERANRLF